MIDLTPLDVRKKKGDFRRGIRGYETPQVDDFLELVADRLEVIVRENAEMTERLKRLDHQLAEFKHREKALTDALVTAQTMREEIRTKSAREGDEVRRQAEEEAAQIRSEAEASRNREEALLQSVRARQLEFLAGYRAFLERELHDLESQATGIEERLGTRIPAPPESVKAPWSGLETVADVVDDGTLDVFDGAQDADTAEAVEEAPAVESQSRFEWAPTDETFKPVTPEAPVHAEPAAAAPPEDDFDAQLGSLLSEWTPSDESDDDDAVDVLLSDDEIEDDVADEMDLFLSDEDIVAARDSSDGDARLFEDDEEAAFVAATGFSSPVAEGEDNDDEAVMLSESDVVAEDESEDSFLNDVDLDSLLSEDPFADEEPAFLIGPAPAREPEPRAETADQAADDSAFLDDLDNEIQASSTESAGPKAMQDVDPFDDDDTGFVIGPASRNGHSNHAEAGTSADAPRDEEDESVAEVEVDALEGEIDIEAHEDEIDIEAHEDDDVGDVDEREGGEEDRSAQDETDSAGDIAAGFGGESETLDHLLNAAGLSRPVQPGPKAQPDGNFAASFGLTLRPTFGENGAEQDEDDANPRQRDEVRDFYSVPRAGE